MTTGFYKAMMAAKYGDEEASVAKAISKSVSAALKAAQAASSKAEDQSVQGQAGPADNSTAAAATNMIPGANIFERLNSMTKPSQVVARLRQSRTNSDRPLRNAAGAAVAAAVNATIARRGALLNSIQTRPERRSSVGVHAADQPTMPSWLSTQEPGQDAGVYTR